MSYISGATCTIKPYALDSRVREWEYSILQGINQKAAAAKEKKVESKEKEKAVKSKQAEDAEWAAAGEGAKSKAQAKKEEQVCVSSLDKPTSQRRHSAQSFSETKFPKGQNHKVMGICDSFMRSSS